ncbi:MAG: outer membrane protein assembly factor BamB family protein [Pirellulales bacterium]
MDRLKPIIRVAAVVTMAMAATLPQVSRGGEPAPAPKKPANQAAPKPAPPALPRIPGFGGGRLVLPFLPIGPAVPAPAAPRSAGEDEEVSDGLFLPADRATSEHLATAKELLAEGRYGEAVRHLSAILEAAEDYFFQPDKKQPFYRSLKSEAGRLLARMPAAGRDSYELQYGATARQLLTAAVDKQDVAGLANVAQRFFPTQAGQEAAFLLGAYHLDGDRPLVAALWFGRLFDAPEAGKRFEPALSVSLAMCWLRAGLSGKANQTLLDLKKRQPTATLRIEGKETPLFTQDAQALSWLAGIAGAPRQRPAQTGPWAMYRGDATRNAPSEGGRPLLNVRWQVPVSNDPLLEKLLDRHRQTNLESSPTLLSGLHPLVVNDVVLMRTARNLLALDFETGKRLWEIPIDDSLDQQLGPSGAVAQFQVTSDVVDGLDRRIREDAAFGTLASDGRRVFSVEDLGLGSDAIMQRPVLMINGRRRTAPGLPKPYNRLAAHDLRTGKLQWEVGGPPDVDGSEQAGAFFLGPPLPLLDRLYVLVEVKNEIRLEQLAPDSGRLEWSQPLASVEQSVLQDPLRRLAGASPSYADGILVCPTSAGAVVAVDLTSRSLLWAYRYRNLPDANADEANAVGLALVGNGSDAYDLADIEGWTDASPMIAEGRVLVTPPGSEQIFCLGLADGKLRWSGRRAGDLYVGCVDDGKVILIGTDRVRALKLADGEAAWEGRAIALPADGTPSGRGFFQKGRYYLPLSTAAVAVIDLAAGQIVGEAKSRKGVVPGNLVCYGGRVVSQGIDAVSAFDQVDDLRQRVSKTLTANPKDPTALVRNGELLLDEGKLQDAVAEFRRSFELTGDFRSRQWLIETLLDGLRVDFAATRKAAPEIERLADQPWQKSAYLRSMAMGLQQAGETLPAFDHYLKLVALESGKPPLEDLDRGLSVRRDRWMQARLALLRAAAKPEDAARMDQAILARLEAAGKAEGPDLLRQTLAYFGGCAVAESAWVNLADRLAKGDSLLEAETAWRRLERSAEVARSREAVARLAMLLDGAKRPEDAAAYYRRLAGDLADVVCWDGKTGRQLVDQLPAGSSVRGALAASDSWPAGAIETSLEKTRRSVVARNFNVALRDDRGPFFSEATVELTEQSTVVGRDGLGRKRWSAPFLDAAETRRGYGFNLNGANAGVVGHLVVLSTGTELQAIDTLGTLHSGAARVLWTQDTTSGSAGAQANWFGGNAWGPRQTPAIFLGGDLAVRYGRPLPTTWIAVGDVVCFQRYRDLVAVHALTGETLWVRHDLPPGCVLSGDEDLLFVTPPGPIEPRLAFDRVASLGMAPVTKARPVEAVVLHPLDGQELGKREVPPIGRRLATLGRLVLSAEATDEALTLRLVDPWLGQERWPARKFAGGTKWCLVGQEAIGLVEPDGRFQLLSLPDGRALIDAKVEAEPDLADVFVLRSRDRYLLIASGPRGGDRPGRNYQPVPGGLDNPLVNGRVHGFDRRTGQKLWSVAVRNQGLMLNQPSELPVLVFMSQVYQSNGSPLGQSYTRISTSVLVLDKRNGRVVRRDQLPTSNGNFELVADPSKKTVELRMSSSALVMTFTNKPLPPAAAQETAKPTEKTTPARALLKALENALPIPAGSMFAPSAEEEP